MTLNQISASLRDLRRSYLALTHEQLGMGNYLSLMHRYQVVILTLIDTLQDIVGFVDGALPPAEHDPESTKEK